jgi:LysR family transcriptional activator of nhaA
MDWLNYHHLYYFWTVAREGSVSRAGEKLLLTGPTISSQLRDLEEAIGAKLFRRAGRGLALTDTGRLVYRHADEIFSKGQDLMDALKGLPAARPRRLIVGVADVLPKLIVYRILEPALRMEEPAQVVCLENKPERLLAELSIQGIDLVLSDAPVPPGVQVRAFSHFLGETGVSVFGVPALAAPRRRRFPRSLDGAPFLLPTSNTSIRRSMDDWFALGGIAPKVLAEFEDNALLATFGGAGAGLFAYPTVIEEEVRRAYGVRLVGRIPAVRERYYVISIERKLKHPGALVIAEAAQRGLFR